ncbi:ABC transporter permease [Hoeflea sp. E7-10]|uniref:ABC transporter permease n=1 Tax=Hoeflea poritis TaxID=2993659 RepID=A0ABT4VVQ4_9HYPH|nr:ABC transporter permease [Hoeflea poritis]
MPLPPRSDSSSAASAPEESGSVDEPNEPKVEVSTSEGQAHLALSGDWQLYCVAEIDSTMRGLEQSLSAQLVTVDFANVGKVDTSGALIVERLRDHLELRGLKVAYQSVGEELNILLDAVGNALRTKYEEEGSDAGPRIIDRILAPVGRLTVSFWEDFIAAMYILGSAVRGTQLKLDRSAGVSPAAIISQMDHTGVRAVPIIALMSFLIGGIIAQQGAFQLRYFGAEIFVVDLVGILQLREIGVLLTAIMIAGRSGSAITAEIGSMKMREEVDALKVMGLNPVGVLVFPRLVALTVMLPALTIVANFAALIGAGLTTWVYSGITPDTFLTRLREAIDMTTIISGMIKAPFMALIIGIVSSVEGLKVGGSAESLGRHVTSAVVKSIFVVILVDGLFAIFYGAIDF